MLQILTRNSDDKRQSPEIIFSPLGLLSFKGPCVLQNHLEFFKELIEWTQQYIKNPAPETNVLIDLYFNEDYVCQDIGAIFKILAPVKPKIKWYVDKSDDDMIDKIENTKRWGGNIDINIINKQSAEVHEYPKTCAPITIEGSTTHPQIEVAYIKEKDVATCTIKGNLSYGYFDEFRAWIKKYQECPRGRTIVIIHLASIGGNDGVRNLGYLLSDIVSIANTQIMWIYEEDDHEMKETINNIERDHQRVDIIRKTLSVERIPEKLTEEKLQNFISEL